MVLNFIQLPLFNDVYYSYTMNIEQENLTFVFRYNERSKSYYVDIYNQDGVPQILGVRIVPEYPLANNHKIGNLTGYFSVEAKHPSLIEKTRTEPENIAEHFVMFYQYETEE